MGLTWTRRSWFQPEDPPYQRWLSMSKRKSQQTNVAKLKPHFKSPDLMQKIPPKDYKPAVVKNQICASCCIEHTSFRLFGAHDCLFLMLTNLIWLRLWMGGGGWWQGQETSDLKSHRLITREHTAGSLLWPAPSLDVIVTAHSCLPTEGITKMMGVPRDQTFPESFENISHKWMQVVGDSFETF